MLTRTLTSVARLPPALPAGCDALLLVVLLAGSAHAGPVSGVIRNPPGRPAGVQTASIVYAEALDASAPRQTGRFTLRQKNKTFLPHVMGIPVGSSIDFPNEDMIFHNVFSLSGPQPFDLGLYRSGQSVSRTFAQSGTYRVFCNIHPHMSALILVVPTPHVTVADPDGRFVLDLPAGRYRLTALSERASPVSVEVVAVAGATHVAELTLDESRWIATQHKNKFGKDYPAASYKR